MLMGQSFQRIWLFLHKFYWKLIALGTESLSLELWLLECDFDFVSCSPFSMSCLCLSHTQKYGPIMEDVLFKEEFSLRIFMLGPKIASMSTFNALSSRAT